MRNFFFTLVLLSLITLLSSCSHTSKHDGPPNFYVDEKRIPNAVPKYERLSKYGNYKSYVVFGKRYYTLPSAKNYDEIGTASWYGMQFHSRKTSSGEPYDVLGMTAAHKTLPLPTYVEVINLKNRRRIVVKVNDRGPFASNRIIDLSYVAAKKLGMIGHGTTKVRVRAITPGYFNTSEPFFADSRATKKIPLATKNSVTHIAQNKKFHFKTFHTAIKKSHLVYLQVGAFRKRYYAEKLQMRLSSLFSTPVKIYNPSINTQLYRVKIGPFENINLADKMTYRLKKLGIHPAKCD